jgi:hypothetical protein
MNILTHIESKSRMTFDILLKEYWGKIYHFGKKMEKIAKDVIFKFYKFIFVLRENLNKK